jgi:hypothetical protein
MPRFGVRVFESVRGCCMRVAGALSAAITLAKKLHHLVHDAEDLG